ncbi:MAG TPA: phosphoribosylanthranilate isomerase [Candidatus Saccharimonadales bacterium]|jgi:phosphoribosylanthranilate isomerase|nr:phosphoribosylanthranilate isomerase [Candidatus Saccharimonadales bacterium]
MRTWIKICATTSVEDGLAAIAAGADALGFVFAPSKRQVTAEQARAIIRALPAGIERIGVFQDETVERIRETVEHAGLTAVQLHGDETPQMIAALSAPGPRAARIGIIKTIVVKDGFHEKLSRLAQDHEGIDSMLLDSGGGSGRTFDWQAVRPLLSAAGMRLIVAGGLTPANVSEAIRMFSPWGVDVVSGVEREPGRKDPEKLKAFVAAVRRTEQ